MTCQNSADCDGSYGLYSDYREIMFDPQLIAWARTQDPTAESWLWLTYTQNTCRVVCDLCDDWIYFATSRAGSEEAHMSACILHGQHHLREIAAAGYDGTI